MSKYKNSRKSLVKRMDDLTLILDTDAEDTYNDGLRHGYVDAFKIVKEYLLERA